MRADNTRHLREAVQRRQQGALERAQAALAEFRRAGASISVSGLAREAKVARSWIYAQPALLAEIEKDRAAPRPAPPAPRTAATDESWQHRLDLAHGRIRDLAAEVKTLRDQLARTHGQLRELRTINGTTRTPSSTQTPS
jgi:hypothetical protein